MSVYIPVELKKEIRNYFADCCAYCRTAEALTVTTFEFEHIIPLSAGGKLYLKIYAWLVHLVIVIKQLAKQQLTLILRMRFNYLIHNSNCGQTILLGVKMLQKL
ncbi:MAG: hypothetical protein RM368_20315 [Nostoc sp. DedSLP03]|nr:hypothetical protein [Nostoc sp. DedSLP03]